MSDKKILAEIVLFQSSDGAAAVSVTVEDVVPPITIDGERWSLQLVRSRGNLGAALSALDDEGKRSAFRALCPLPEVPDGEQFPGYTLNVLSEKLNDFIDGLKAAESRASAAEAERDEARAELAKYTGRRAPMQGSRYHVGKNGYEDKSLPRKGKGVGAGNISWDEHLLCWSAYAAQYSGQSAERLAERGGFSWTEFEHFIGREPETWMPGPVPRKETP